VFSAGLFVYWKRKEKSIMDKEKATGLSNKKTNKTNKSSTMIVAKAATRMVAKAVKNIDLDDLKEKAAQASETIADKAVAARDAAMDVKEDIDEKLTRLDRMLEQSVTDYNDAFTLMNDKGIRLYVERSKAADVITNVENLVNSIANHPKSFDVEFEEIEMNRSHFTDSCEFADRELQAAREAAGGAGAGLAAGASVAFMGPTAAMWVATTFGTASTGTAISALSGAAATNAALAWLGGGTLAAGGGGTAAGSALLAMAGPIGWTIAGATLLSSILLFAKKKTKLNKEKNAEIESVKNNTERVKELDASINNILTETVDIMNGLKKNYTECLTGFGRDYMDFTDEEKVCLGALVNNTKALSAMFDKTVA